MLEPVGAAALGVFLTAPSYAKTTAAADSCYPPPYTFAQKPNPRPFPGKEGVTEMEIGPNDIIIIIIIGFPSPLRGEVSSAPNTGLSTNDY